MTCVIHGGFPLKGDITIPSSFSESAALLSLSSFSSIPQSLRNVPDSYGIKSLRELLSSSVKDTDKLIKLEITDDFEHFFCIPPLLFKGFKVSLLLTSDQPNNFSGFLKMLSIFNDVSKTGKDSFAISKSSNLELVTIDAKEFGFDEILFSILLSIAHNSRILILNYPKDPRLKSFLKCLESVGGSVLTDSENVTSVSIYLRPPFEYVLDAKSSYSIHKACFFSLAAAATEGLLNVNNIDASELLPLTAKLVKWGISVESNEPSHLKVRSVPSNVNIEADIDVKSYPGFIPSWGNLCLVFLSFYSKSSTLTFPIINSPEVLLKELNRLGGGLDFQKNSEDCRIYIRGNNFKSGKKIMLENRKFLLPLLLFALILKGRTTFVNFEIMLDYYKDVVDILRDMGAHIDIS